MGHLGPIIEQYMDQTGIAWAHQSPIDRVVDFVGNPLYCYGVYRDGLSTRTTMNPPGDMSQYNEPITGRPILDISGCLTDGTFTNYEYDGYFEGNPTLRYTYPICE